MSDTIRIVTFQDALKETEGAQRNLLLGNGFSIACEPGIFNYPSLYARAAERIKAEMPEVHAIFERLGTKDFEVVVQMLNHTEATLPHYLPAETSANKRIKEHAENLKGILVSTIAEHHPEFPAKIAMEKFAACRRFLANFIHPDVNGRVYTLNYDLLLYWTALHSEADGESPIDLTVNDGFGRDDSESNYVIWMNEGRTQDQRMFYLHGAVHLFDNGPELEKYTWHDKGRPLIEQAREALSRNKFPLFVAEGSSAHKLERIRHHPYLHHGFKSFLEVTKEGGRKGAKPKPLFVYGHSFADNDKHILSRITKGSIKRLYVSLYGDPNSDTNQAIVRRALAMKSQRASGGGPELEVTFFSAESAEVWGS